MAGRPREIAEQYAGRSTREAILLAAEELAGEVGPTDLKLREIARRVGIEAASIYNHFKGITGLLAELVNESLQEEHKLLALPPGLVGEDAIRELNRRTTSYLSQRKGIVSLSLIDFAEANSKTRTAFDENQSVIVKGLDVEANLIGLHLGLQRLGRAKLGQIAISRRSMILTLMSQTWLNKREVTKAREKEIANLVSAFVLGLPSQMAE